jgi:2'-5' RNA ligase
MDAIRAFIAIELPGEIQEKLGQLIRQVQEHAPKAVRWVPANNIHLTLKFLGNISPSNLNTLIASLQMEALRHRVMQFCVGGIGAFPNRSRPRVVWAGVTAPPELLVLQQGIDRETSRLGYPGEERGFSPHLTLGRVSQHANAQEVRQVGDALARMSVGELGWVVVKQLILFRSDLQPGGAVYSQLAKSPLSG